MEKVFIPSGVCSRQITIDVNENDQTINSVSFVGGCNGNLKGIASLVKAEKLMKLSATLRV